MVSDPYKALGLSHNATPVEIKSAYRKIAMNLHPDRLTRENASPRQIQDATLEFAKVTSAYSILSDSNKKSQYDHIYKYGGYDETEDQENNNTRANIHVPNHQYQTQGSQYERPSKKSVGYTLYNPCAFILSAGKEESKSVAALSLPTRWNGRFGYSMSTGALRKSPSGNLEFTSKTSGYKRGEKFQRIEKAKVHRDGRKKVLIQDNKGHVERRFSQAPSNYRPTSRFYDDDCTTVAGQNSWYLDAWDRLQDAWVGSCGALNVG